MGTVKLKALGLAAVVALGAPGRGAAQVDARAATRPAPERLVVVTWPAAPAVSRYNLYRKTDLAAPYPAIPLNPRPMEVLTDSAAITALIPQASLEWNLLARGLANSPGATDFDPLAVATIPRESNKWVRLQMLAQSNWRIVVLVGQGYADTDVVVGRGYYYEVRGVDAAEAETGALTTDDVPVTGGSPVPFPPPAGLTAQAGDSKVLLLWGDVRGAAGFHVERATASVGPFVRVNEVSFTARIDTDLNGDPIVPGGRGSGGFVGFFSGDDSSLILAPAGVSSRNGFVDFERYDEFGNPIVHDVAGSTVKGPVNGTKYYYRVTSLDLLGQAGPPTTSAVAIPLDLTAPQAPQGLEVTANEPADRLELRWLPVTRDVEGHPEAGIAGYRTYRYESPSDPNEKPVEVDGSISFDSPYVTATDADPVLRSRYGEKTYFYRLEAQDSSGNLSFWSVAASGYLKDIIPPAPPRGLAAEGFEEFIRLEWDRNSEPDMDGYLIYRSFCHLGSWPSCQDEIKEEPGRTCHTPFVLVGSVSQPDAGLPTGRPIFRVPGVPEGQPGGQDGTLGLSPRPFFIDRNVPAGSPLCYAYWVKAQDRSQNKSGSWPLPAHLKVETVVCERLRDRTPPEPAILSGLSARDHEVLVEWIGPPVQDIGAYHVYRSEAEAGPYVWVGGATVAPREVLTAPYAPATSGCASIPLIPGNDMSEGFFEDTGTESKRIYWYKVVGVDQAGNEAPLDRAAPVSTFTFDTAAPPTPTLTAVASSPSPGGFLV